MKKIISLVSIVSINLLIFWESFAYNTEFANNADYLASRNIIKFQANKNDYKLTSNITRWEVSKIVFGLFNEFNSDDIYFKCDETYFKDIKKDNQFCDYITPLVDQNIFKKSDFFNVNRNLTRSELILILGRTLEIKPTFEAKLSYKDVSNKADYYWYLDHFIKQWWIKSSDYFRPNSFTTRGEVFTIITRMLKK